VAVVSVGLTRGLSKGSGVVLFDMILLIDIVVVDLVIQYVYHTAREILASETSSLGGVVIMGINDVRGDADPGSSWDQRMFIASWHMAIAPDHCI
jgi:hypothetical protein